MDEVGFEEVMQTQAALMRGIFAELRALRLTVQATTKPLSAVDASELAQAVNDGDQIALLFAVEDEPDPVRVLS